MKSKFFRSLIEEGLLSDDHIGGCVLFEKRDWIEKILLEKKEIL
jgi:hypothetical protein